MEDYRIVDRQPTITTIKARLAELNGEINLFANEGVQVSDWSIHNMKKPFYIKKYNSNRYDTNEERPFVTAVNQGWWGDSHTSSNHNWGINKFPNDTKAWWIGDSGMISWRSADEVSEFAYLYYLYEAPEAETVTLYKVGWQSYLKINGQSVDFTPDGQHWPQGLNATFNLMPGKNVFEIKVVPGVPSSGTVLYVSNKYNNILFRTGDPGWGVSYRAVPDYTLITSSNIRNKNKRSRMNVNIQDKINDIDTMITKIAPYREKNMRVIKTNTEPLLAELADLKETYRQLLIELKEPIILEGKEEVTDINATANFSNYMLLFVFTLFLVISLIFIYKNPEVGNLDLFILAIALVILLYYLYEYIQKRKRTGKKA